MNSKPIDPQSSDLDYPPREHPSDPADETLTRKSKDRTRDHRLPERIGRYKILERLGEGGMGVVYLAEQSKPIRRRVALKVIKLGMDTKQVIARFETERQALAVMDHPGVAKVFDAGTTEDGRPYFVMEHVPGVPITEHCDRHKLNIEERLHLFMQLCDAVQHAHQKGVIHRDIKPKNVLVSVKDEPPHPPLAKGWSAAHPLLGKGGPGGVAKVIDFGVAKAISQPLTEKTLFTEQGQLIGTPAYMSPEQAEMTAQDIDTRTDIYSLGVLLYELLTGALPFDPKSLRRAAFDEIRRIIRDFEPPNPSTKLSGIIAAGDDTSTATARNRRTNPRLLTGQLRGDLDWITMKALEKDRTRRYATPSALAEDIVRHLRHEPVVASPPTAAYRVKKFVRRNRGFVTAAGVVFVVLLGGIAGTTIALLDAIDARAEAERQGAIAKAVNDFLNDDLLAAVAPEEQGKDVTMREVLDKASGAIEGKFNDQALVEASIRTTVGNTYLSLGEYKPARPHLERALGLRRNELGHHHPDTLTSIDNMGALLWWMGKYDECSPYWREALEARRRVLGDDHPDTLESINNMGMLLQSMGKLAEAEPYLREALEGSRRVLGDDHPRTLISINNMGGLLQSMGKLAEAEPYYRDALEGHRRVLGDDHPETLASINNMGGLLVTMGKLDEAEPYYREALEGLRRVLGDDHSNTLSSINNMGSLLVSMGKYDEALPYCREALEGGRRVLGNDHPDTLIWIYNMGRLLRDLGALEEAEALGAEAVRGARQSLPEGHWLTGVFLGGYGKTLTQLERYADGEAALLEAHQILEAARGAEHKRTIKVIRFLVDLYDAWDTADPGKGYGAKAAKWRAKLPEPGGGNALP